MAWYNPLSWFGKRYTKKPAGMPPMVLLHYKALLRFMEMEDEDLVSSQQEILRERGYEVPKTKKRCAKIILNHGGP